MDSIRVAPTTPAPEVAPAFVYAFHCRRRLPALDGAKAIKHVVLHPYALVLFNRFVHRARGWMTLAFAVGFVCSIAMFFVSARPGAWLGTSTLVFQFPSYLAAYLSLRYDFAKLVFLTFEFWYAVVVNLVCNGVMWFSYHDWRSAMLISSALAYQVPFLMDGVSRGATATIVASTMGGVLDAVCIVLLMFHSIPDVPVLIIYTHKNLSLQANDLVLNTLGTVVVLLIRNAYRKHEQIKHQRKNRSLRGSFIMYRCCLELRELRAFDPVVLSHQSNGPRLADSTLRPMQLFFDRPDKTFDARCVMWPQRLLGQVHLTPWPCCVQGCLWLFGLTGLVSIAVVNPSATLSYQLPVDSVQWIAFGTTLLFFSTYFVHAQRHLLRELCGSFDFVFMTFQFTAAHLCGCIMFDWDKHCLMLAVSWLWSLWVITLDAVTPVMKRKLGYHTRGAMVVVLVQLMEQIMLIVSILVFDPFFNRNYSLLHIVIGGHVMNVHVVQFILWRTITCFLWSARLLWRLFDRQGDELLVLQGRVEYIEPERRRRRSVIAPSTNACDRFEALTPQPQFHLNLRTNRRSKKRVDFAHAVAKAFLKKPLQTANKSSS